MPDPDSIYAICFGAATIVGVYFHGRAKLEWAKRRDPRIPTLPRAISRETVAALRALLRLSC